MIITKKVKSKKVKKLMKRKYNNKMQSSTKIWLAMMVRGEPDERRPQTFNKYKKNLKK